MYDNRGKSEKSKKNLKVFKPGESGNPKGRPKGKSLTTILKEIMDRTIDVTDPISHEISKKTIAEVINLRMVAKAIDGNFWAVKECWDRMEGTARQTMDVTTRTGKYEEMAGLTDKEALEELKKRLIKNVD